MGPRCVKEPGFLPWDEGCNPPCGEGGGQKGPGRCWVLSPRMRRPVSATPPESWSPEPPYGSRRALWPWLNYHSSRKNLSLTMTSSLFIFTLLRLKKWVTTRSVDFGISWLIPSDKAVGGPRVTQRCYGGSRLGASSRWHGCMGRKGARAWVEVAWQKPERGHVRQGVTVLTGLSDGKGAVICFFLGQIRLVVIENYFNQTNSKHTCCTRKKSFRFLMKFTWLSWWEHERWARGRNICTAPCPGVEVIVLLEFSIETLLSS